MWTRYTSSGERRSTNDFRVDGTLMNGGIGPDEVELGVDEPEEAGVFSLVEPGADFVMLLFVCFSVETLIEEEMSSEVLLSRLAQGNDRGK